MAKTIAIAGKGGTGKTTVAALLILYLADRGIVLAVDGDPSSNLNLSLGLPLKATIGDVREEMTDKIIKGTFGVGISKPDYLEAKIRQSLLESEKIDLLAMGRPEGPGCYCAANEMLRGCLGRLERNYDYIVIDNEAGMEHISRQTTQNVNTLLLVSDPSLRGIITAARMKELIYELRTQVGKIALIINRADKPLPPKIDKAIKEYQLELVGLLPTDADLEELEISGSPISQLPQDSPLKQEMLKIIPKLKL
jgi:CO dehydrogenase maturation factor